jgi:hypothetical protein
VKDSVIALAESVRLARLELECYRDPRCAQTAEWTIDRLQELLLSPAVGRALLGLVPDAESPSAESPFADSPSIVPDQTEVSREQTEKMTERS